MTRLCLFLCFLLSRFALVAQTPDTATLRGQVMDPSRAAVGDAQIELTNGVSGFQRIARSYASGKFVVSGLPAGTYTLSAQKDKFAAFHRELTLVGGTTADVQVQLSISEVQTDIVVTGAVGEIRVDEPQLGDRLGK